ncbi:MAG: hypothetical protein RLZZ139_871, partial [Cyanobacteriota bacterium]
AMAIGLSSTAFHAGVAFTTGFSCPHDLTDHCPQGCNSIAQKSQKKDAKDFADFKVIVDILNDFLNE